jgi:hypothetical protein
VPTPGLFYFEEIMAYTDPDVPTFKAYFNRDFPYTTDINDLTAVTDVDITKALSQQENLINQNLFANQAIYTQGALLLAAHFLVMNLRASSQGIAGKYDWLTSHKAVGSVNSSFEIPQRILDNPELAILAGTTYGVQFLYIVIPLLTGQMFAVAGGTVGIGEGGLFSGVYGSIGPWGSGQ